MPQSGESRLGGAQSQHESHEGGVKGGASPPPRMSAPLCCST